MTGAEIALDTNQAIAVLNATGDTTAWIQTFTDIYLPVVVIGELRFGALNSGRAAQNLRRIEQLVSRCRVLDATVGTAEVYARIRLHLKQKGKPIPENDLWIATLCVEHDLPLATSDVHFAEVDDLKVVKR
jgi:tRNA(fMet)-specific endonuclease VapC